MRKDDTIFTVRGRLRLLAALTAKMGREAWFACDRGFISNDAGGTDISDTKMIQVLTEMEINISQALSTHDPSERNIVNARVEALTYSSG